MEVLVTGGAGFIGSNIVERLISEGHSVTVIDCLNTGSENNLAGVRDKIKFVRGNSGEIEKLVSGKNSISSSIRGFTLLLHYIRKTACSPQRLWKNLSTYLNTALRTERDWCSRRLLLFTME